jgi:hypothetical protein
VPVHDVRSNPIGTATLDLRYGATRIRVESDDVSHLEWRREFLTPAFDVAEALRPDSTVRLVTDPVGCSAEWFPGLSNRLRRRAYHHRLSPVESHCIALGHDAYADASSASRLLEAVGG